MVKNVFELLREIYNGNFDNLPERIKVHGEIYTKTADGHDYINKENDEFLFNQIIYFF